MTLISVDPSIQSGHLVAAVFFVRPKGDPLMMLTAVHVWRSKLKSVDDRLRDIRDWFEMILEAHQRGILLTEDLLGGSNWARGERAVRGREKSLKLTIAVNERLITLAESWGWKVVKVKPSATATKIQRLQICDFVLGVDWGVCFGVGKVSRSDAADAIWRGQRYIKEQRLREAK